MKQPGQCKPSIDQSYRAYLQDVQSAIETDSKKFWAYCRNNRQTNTYPTVLRAGQKTATNSEDISNLFARHFEAMYTASAFRTFSPGAAQMVCQYPLPSFLINHFPPVYAQTSGNNHRSRLFTRPGIKVWYRILERYQNRTPF